METIGAACKNTSDVNLALFGDSDGNLYLLGQRSVRKRSSSGQIEDLAQVECNRGAQFTALWGNSRQELFVTYTDPGQAGSCGATFAAWYDGTAMHPL